MGYLEDTWRGHDAELIAAKSPDEKRECMRMAFYLGAKALLDAIAEAQAMETDEGTQFLAGICDEWIDFSHVCAAEAFAMIVGGLAAAMGRAK